MNNVRKYQIVSSILSRQIVKIRPFFDENNSVNFTSEPRHRLSDDCGGDR